MKNHKLLAAFLGVSLVSFAGGAVAMGVNNAIGVAENNLSILWGDVNGDGKVNGADVVLLRRYLAGWDVKLGPDCVHEYGYAFDAVNHWQECSLCGEAMEKQPHTYNTENACTVCDYTLAYSVGLNYTLNNEENGYIVTGLGGCTDTALVIPSYYNDKPVVAIREWAFLGCSSLTSVVIPNSVTSIGERAFQGCESLTSVDIPDGVTSIGVGAFLNCSSLTSVDIPNSVTSIGDWALENGSSLNVYYDGELADWLNIISERSPFGYSTVNLYLKGELLKELIIPEGVTSIGWAAFSGYGSLTSIVIPNSVTSIGMYAFGWCESLTNIVIPNGVTSIGNGAFHNCSSLTSVDIPNSVTSIGWGAFLDCVNLKDVYYDGELADWLNIDLQSSPFGNIGNDGINLYLNGELVEELVIPDGVTSIGGYAFKGCSSLTNIVIPNSVTSIGDYAFLGCGLTSIAIPDSVTSIGDGAFGNYGNLKEVYYDGELADWLNIEFRGSNFFGANLYLNGELVEELVIPNGVTSIGAYAFCGYSSLTSVVIPDGVTSIEKEAFGWCDKLTSVVIPNSVTSIGDWAFNGCSSLTSIVIPDGVTSIGELAFAWCDNLTSIVIPDGVTSIGAYAFGWCDNLTSVVIPDGVTSIGMYAFEVCSSLTSVVIPNSVTSIGDCAFFDCVNLKDVYYTGSAEEWAELVGDETIFSNSVALVFNYKIDDGKGDGDKDILGEEDKLLA